MSKSENFLDLNKAKMSTVTLSFVFDKYCPILD